MQAITLTGADERTSIEQLQELVKTYPAVEVGILYRASGSGNRYPTWFWIKEAVAALSGRVALHICGHQAKAQLEAGTIPIDFTKHLSRMQINGHVTKKDLARFRVAAKSVPLITQHNTGNQSLAAEVVFRHQLLVDASGGLGISPASWKRPADAGSKRVGFAGGLGPDNLAAELPKIAIAAGEHLADSWVDMEAKLRDADDWFDITRAMQCAEIFTRWRESIDAGLVS